MLTQDKIKVHVTQTEREYLEFLVNRRLNDVSAECVRPNRFKTCTKDLSCKVHGEEMRQLTQLKYELSQAGS
jgi:hypothetical protein